MPTAEPTLPALVRSGAVHAPDAVALVAPGHAGALTRDRLSAEVELVADALAALGVTREDRVAVVLPNGPEMAIAFLAVSGAAVCAPLNPSYRAAEFEFYLDDLRARALVLGAGDPSPAREVARARGIPIIELLPTAGAPPGVFTLRGAPFGDPRPRVPPRGDDVALILHTSGTTARPKIVPIYHRNLYASARSVAAALRLGADDRCLNVMPLFHIHGLVAGVLAPLSSGGSVICPPGFVVTEFFDWLAAFAPTWYTAVPTIHRSVLARSALHPAELAGHRLRLIRSSSSPLSPDVMEALETTFGVPVIEAYGMTEAAHQMTCNPLPPAARKPGSVGVSAGAEVTILDEAGAHLPAGARGEISIRGPGVISGYHDNPEANASSFQDGWFRTGDEGYLDEDGYLFISGRIKEIINRAGEKVSPREVDEVLLQHPAVGEATCFGLPDPELGEAVAAAVVLRPGRAATESELRAHAATHLALYKVPIPILIVDAIPKSSVGKPQRIGLYKKLGLVPREIARTPGTEASGIWAPLERAVAGIWTEVLRLPRVGRNDRFLDLGGDSVLAARALARLRALAQADLPLTLFFDAPTVATQAARITELMEAGRGPTEIPRLARGGDLPLSSVQESIWLADRIEGNGLSNLRSTNVRLRGPLDADRLERAVAALFERHEIVRATFPDVAGTPVVRLLPAGALRLERVDLRSRPPAGAEEEALALVLAEARRPLDLARGPVVRAALLAISDTEHLLLLTFHHIVFDAWSAGLILEELGAGYRAALDGLPDPEPPEIQYADFAAWQRAQQQEAQLEGHLAYWRGQLAGLAPVQDLATDRPRPPRASFGGARQPIAISPALTAALRDRGRPEGATLFMVVLAAYQVLLSRWSGGDDVAVVCTIANRPLPVLERLIGIFFNLLVLRTDLSGTPTFRELLARVRKVTLEGYEHQELPFEQLVVQLNPERSAGARPFSQVAFTLHNVQFAQVAVEGVSFEPAPAHNGTAQYDLNLILDEGPAGLTGALEYATDLFDAETIARMAGHLQVLLEAAVADPDRRVSELPLLTEAERHQLLVSWNDTAAPYPDPSTVHALVEAQVDRTPAAPAVVFEARSLSYRELDDRANRLAHRLIALGAAPGARIGIALDRSADLVAGVLGILKAGAAYVPLDPTYPAERLAFMIEDAGLALLVSEPGIAEALPPHAARVVLMDAPAADLPAWRPADRARPEDIAYVIYTSGTTGRPKGVEISHRAAVNLLTSVKAQPGLTAADRLLAVTSLSFDISVLELFLTLSVGAQIHMADRATAMDGAALRRRLEQNDITVLQATPSTWRLLLDAGWQGTPGLACFVGGEAVSRAFADALLSRARAVWNMYGPTETTIYSIIQPLAAGTGPVLIGRPIANTRVAVLDRHLALVPAGVTGELHIGGAGLARGYLGRPELTRERFIDDPFVPGERLYRTGDLARWRPEGEAGGAIECLGRIDHQVKLRGYRIELGEIEAVIRTVPGVRDTVAILREDSPGDPRLVAYVVPAAEAVPAGVLRERLAATVPDYMIPAAFVMLEALPRTPNGKLDRKALPRPELPSSGSRTMPRTPAEEVLAGIWADVLGLERVGIEDDFFALGGHSLLGTRILSRVRAALGVELPLRTLFETPTIAYMAERIAAGKAQGAPAAPPLAPGPREDTLPLSYAQQRLWLVDQLEPGTATYNIPLALRLDGPLDASALERGLAEIVRRHDALRTTFPTVAGEPCQVIAADVAFRLPIVELAALPGPEREPEARRLASEDAARSFDLARGPLIRGTLVRLAPDAHVLLLCMHHIVSDGWSIAVLTRELAALYAAFSAGGPSPLPELPIQYADHARWQRAWPGEVLEGQLAYWKQQLQGAPAALSLPVDRPRPAVESHRGARLPIRLSRELAAALAALSRREGVTLFMTLLAAFQVLLHRHAGQADVVVGSPVAGRTRVETEALIGFLVNTLVLRARLGDDPSFRALLAQAREATLGAHAHQDVPFEKLVEELAPPRDLGRSPLFQAMFIFQNARSAPPPLGAVAVQRLAVERSIAKFELTLMLEEMDSGLTGSLEYATDLFDAETIARMAGHLQVLLEAVVTDPDRRVSALPLLTEAERHQLLVTWNDTAAPYPDPSTVHALVEAQVDRTPAATAVVFGERALSYRELDERANRLAHRLIALGAGPGARVGIALDRSPDLIAGVLGILKAGAAYVPLDPGYPADRLAFMIEDAGLALLVSEPGVAQTLPPHAARVVLVDPTDAPDVPAARPAPRARPDDIAYVIYTSGTTGRPKGVEIPHRAVVNFLTSMQARPGLTAADRLLAVTSLSFDISGLELLLPLSVGAQVHVADRDTAMDGAALRRRLERDAITVLQATPSTWRLLLDAGWQGGPGFTALVGGEAVPRELVDALAPRARAVWNMYGPTETTIWSCVHPLAAGDGPVLIGRPIANTRVAVLDRHLAPVPIGVTGELYIGGAGLARGYLGRPELTRERFIDDPFVPGERLYRTGDLARFRPEGTLECLGRIDHQVKLRGYRIELGEIEAVLAEHPAVRETVVAVCAERLVGYLVARDPGAKPAPGDLRRHLRVRLPDIMIPAAFVVLDAIPLLPNGKIDRAQLPAPGAGAPRSAPPLAPPRDEVEAQLAAIFCSVLGVPAVGVTDSFFDLGGHSMLAVRVLAEIKRGLGKTLPLIALFRAQTVEQLAPLLRADGAPPSPSGPAGRTNR